MEDSPAPAELDAAEAAAPVTLSADSQALLAELRRLPTHRALGYGINMEAVEDAVRDAQATDADIALMHRHMLAARELEEEGRDSIVDRELATAVRDQFGQLGVTLGDLRTYLEVAVDVDAATQRGALPRIEPTRFAAYKKVHALVTEGQAKTKEEREWLKALVEEEVLAMPWPSTVLRQWQLARGEKLRRLRKPQVTQYSQVCSLVSCHTALWCCCTNNALATVAAGFNKGPGAGVLDRGAFPVFDGARGGRAL